MKLVLSCLVLAGCSAPARPPKAIGNTAHTGTPVPARPTACDATKVAGTVHDLDDKDAPLPGVTLVVSTPGKTAGDSELSAVADEDGRFSISTPTRFVTVTAYYADVTFEGKLPACTSKLWLGLHNTTVEGGKTYPLVFR